MVKTQKLGNMVSDKAIIGLLLSTCGSIFLFNEPARTMFNQGKFNTAFNLLYIVFCSLTIAVFIYKECLDIRIVLVTFAFAGGALITQLASKPDLFHFVNIIPSLIMPFLTTAFIFPAALFEQFFEKLIKATNVVIIILVIIGICDYFSGAALQMFLAQHHIFDDDQARLAMSGHARGIYRYYSLIGHPLANAWYLLAFYILNILNNRHFKQVLNEYLVTLVMLIGLLLCGSRSALIIGFLMIVFLNNRKNKAAFILILSVVSVGLAMTPMFQKNIMQRFIIGSTSGDPSEGRNMALSWVFNGYVKPPPFFLGGGSAFSRTITSMMGGFISSFEYPFMMFAYDFSIVGTILIYIIVLVIPILIFLKNESYTILAFFLAISLYLNGFNAISNYTDYMGQFCFIIMILINMSYVIRSKREKSVEI